MIISIHWNLLKKDGLANLKPEVDELDVDELKNVPNGLSSLRSKIDRLDIGKLETIPTDLSKPSNGLKNEFVKNTENGNLVEKVILLILVNLLKKQIIILRLNMFKIKYLVLLA